MGFRPEHELHARRKSLNIGVGVMLGAFVVLVMLLTFVKITSTDFKLPASQATGVGAQVPAGGSN